MAANHDSTSIVDRLAHDLRKLPSALLNPANPNQTTKSTTTMDKSALSRATDTSSSPTPGYLYNDIAKTLVDPTACVETLNYLTNRLSSKNNPHVKRKCLKVLAKCASHPASRGMMRRAAVQSPAAISAIKEASGYRGAKDAVNGDMFNVQVREAAKECLEAVYSDDGNNNHHNHRGGGVGGVGGVGGGGQLQGGGMQGLGGGGISGGYGGGGGGGYGAPAPASSSSSNAAPGGGRMQGIGNPMYADPRMAPGGGGQAGGGRMGQVKEMAMGVGGAVMEMIKDPMAKNVAAPNGGGGGMGRGGYDPNARPDPYAQPPPGRNNLAMQTGGQWTMASNRGPNAVGSAANAVPSSAADAAMASHRNSEYYKAKNAQGGQAFSWAGGAGVAVGAPSAAPPSPAAPPPSGVGGSWASAPAAPPPQPPVGVAAQSRAEAHGQGAGMVVPAVPVASGGAGGFGGGGNGAGGRYEKDLIAELCPPGGMKAEPPADRLAEFARAVPSLDPDLVCPALLDALEEGNPWIMRAKALCVIETVLNVEAESGGGVAAYSDFFHACSGEIEPLSNHARASVKGPARRVLAALGVDAGAAAMVNGAGTAKALNNTVSAPAAPPANLLDFDEPQAPGPAPAPSAAPGQAAPVLGGPSSALFSGLNTKAAPAAPPQASTAPPVVQQSQQNDFFGGMNVANATPSAPAASDSGASDLFGNMTLKSSAEPTNLETAPSEPPANSVAAAAVPGSAFGFMNAAGPTSPTQPPKTLATPTPPSPKSFDPLLSMGMPDGNATQSPNPNANQMAQMQMQMAYQQNMMMMQQQMQQMQMANYQRQGSGGVGGGMGGPPAMPGMGAMPSKQPIMTANYMRQVPGVSGDKMSSFSFLGSDPKKEDNKSFDFVKDAMKNG